MNENFRPEETECLRCGYKWYRRVPHPLKCPKCTNVKWNVKRKQKRGRKKFLE